MKPVHVHLMMVFMLLGFAGCATNRSSDPGALDVPRECAATQHGLREVGITWAIPSDASDTYRIERSLSAESGFERIGEATSRKGSYTDRGAEGQPLLDNTTYYYRLVAVSSRGAEGAYGETVSSTTAPPPDAPVGLEVTAPKSRGVKLTWSPSTSDGVVKYRVERTEAAQPDAFATIAEVPGVEYMDGGTASSTLKDSTLYQYRVTTINRVNSAGMPTEPVEVTTMPPPDAPKNVKTESRQVRCVPLTWDASPEEDVIRYDIYRSNSKKGPFEKIGDVRDRNQPHFLDGKNDPGNLEDDETYYYRVRAVNDVTAESEDSEIVSAETREVPPRVENVKVSIRQPREVPLTWQASPDEKVLGYEIWRAEGDGDYSLVGRVGGRDTTSYVDRGGHKQFPDISLLKDDTVYNYKIIAFNTAYAKSSASDPASSQTKASPAQPAAPDTTTNLPHAINLTWPANAETDIVAYAVEASNNGTDFRWLATVPAIKGEGFAHAREANLDQSVQRRYRIQAIDVDRLVSPWSQTISGRAKPIPDAPTNLRLETVDAGVRISWDPPEQPDIKAYKLYTKSVFSFEPYAVSETPSFVVEWPNLKSPIRIMVSAVDMDNLESQRSEPITVSPK